MRRNQVRNQVSDSVEHGFDQLHRIVDRCLLYPLAAVEGAIQGFARGVHKLVTYKHPLDRATGAVEPDECECECKYKSKLPDPSYGQPVGPSGFYGYPPPASHPPQPPAPPQFHYHQAFPVPCRPPH